MQGETVPQNAPLITALQDLAQTTCSSMGLKFPTTCSSSVSSELPPAVTFGGPMPQPSRGNCLSVLLGAGGRVKGARRKEKRGCTLGSISPAAPQKACAGQEDMQGPSVDQHGGQAFSLPAGLPQLPSHVALSGGDLPSHALATRGSLYESFGRSLGCHAGQLMAQPRPRLVRWHSLCSSLRGYMVKKTPGEQT